jgi:hypothetical protein
MRWIFIEPNKFLNLPMLLDIFLSFKALEHFFILLANIGSRQGCRYRVCLWGGGGGGGGV